MATYTFKCNQCGTIDDVEMPMSEYVDSFDCGCLPDCSGTMQRHYAGTAPAISKVPGAGGTPARPSR